MNRYGTAGTFGRRLLRIETIGNRRKRAVALRALAHDVDRSRPRDAGQKSARTRLLARIARALDVATARSTAKPALDEPSVPTIAGPIDDEVPIDDEEEADDAEPEPVVVSPSTTVYVRAYAEPDDTITSTMRKPAIEFTCSNCGARFLSTQVRKQGPHACADCRPKPDWAKGEYLIFDTETVAYPVDPGNPAGPKAPEMTFGYYELWQDGRLSDEGVFYNPKTVTDAAGFRSLCIGVNVWTLDKFQRKLGFVRKRGGSVVGFNVSYDLFHLFDRSQIFKAGPEDRATRRDSRFRNGFEVRASFPTPDGGRKTYAFWRTKRDDRFKRNDSFGRGHIIDASSFFKALTDKGASLAGACEVFGIDFESRAGEHSGEVTRENIAGCIHDVRKTRELFFALVAELGRHPIALAPHNAQSPARLAKKYLEAFGVKPRMQLQPDFSRELMGQAAAAYFGGRVEARVVRAPVPVVYMDALSMYPTVFALTRLWYSHVIPAELTPRTVDAAEVQSLVDGIAANPSVLFDPQTWPKLAFYAAVDPNGAMLPSRIDVGRDTNVSVGPVSSTVPLWYSGLDLAAAVLLGEAVPRVVSAWRLEGGEPQRGLRSVRFRGADLIDPRVDDLFRRAIELRKRKTADKLDDDRRSSGYKCVANSGSYGIWAETNPEDIDPADPRTKPVGVSVWAGDAGYESHALRPEQHGAWAFFPVAAHVTAGARLMLALGQWALEREGGTIAYCDTDSLAVIATKDGGSVRVGDSDRRALSWSQVERARSRFEALNPYDPGSIAGSVWKVEDVNFDAAQLQQELTLYAIREKLYALYVLRDGAVDILDYKAHGVGYYRSPYPGDKKGRWIGEAWERVLRIAHGLAPRPLAFEGLPAIAQLTLTTYNVWRHYRATLRPSDFVTVATPGLWGFLACCSTPRPAAMYFDDASRWKEAEWRCLACGSPLDLAWSEAPFATYRHILWQAFGCEAKRVTPSFHTVREEYSGMTVPRRVEVSRVVAIGKEVIVDVSEAPIGDDRFAESLNATPSLRYDRPEAFDMDGLRARIRDVGIGAWERESGLRLRNIGPNAKAATLERSIAAVGQLEARSATVPIAPRDLVEHAKRVGLGRVSKACGVSPGGILSLAVPEDYPRVGLYWRVVDKLATIDEEFAREVSTMSHDPRFIVEEGVIRERPMSDTDRIRMALRAGCAGAQVA